MIRIKVPATSANIGSGFDCLGIALNIYNYFEIEERDKGLEILGCDKVYANENNLVVAAINKVFERVGYACKGLYIKIDSHIPVARGLGSSAACIIAGVLAGNEITKANLSKEQLLEIATEIEGHPDNLAAALYGGLTIAIKEEDEILVENVQVSDKLRFYAMIPNFTLSTEKSRGILPEKLDFQDAVFNIGRVAMLIRALEKGDMKKIQIGCKDRIHEKYRRNLIDNYLNIINICENAGATGVVLSGAGPTILALVNKKTETFEESVKMYLDNKWKIQAVNVVAEGAIIERKEEM